MLNSIFNDFASSPLNTTANILGTGISIKFLDIAQQSLDISKENLKNSQIAEDNKILLQNILHTNQEIIRLLNIIISKLE